MVTDGNIHKTMPTDKLSGWPCECGLTFTSEKGMKIHRSKYGCTNAVPDVQQLAVAAACESSDDHSQGQHHSAMNTYVVLSEDENKPPFERPDGSRIKKFKFLFRQQGKNRPRTVSSFWKRFAKKTLEESLIHP